MARKADGTDVRGYSWGDAREPDLLWQHLRDLLQDPESDLMSVHDFVFSEFINSSSSVARGSICPSPACSDAQANLLFLRFWIVTLSIGSVPDICGHAIRRFMGPEGETWWRLEVQMEYNLPHILRDARGLEDAASVTQQLDRLFMDMVESRTRGTTSGRYNELVLRGPRPDAHFPDFYDVLLLAAQQGRRVDLSLPVVLETARSDGLDADLDISDVFVLDCGGDIFGPNHYGWQEQPLKSLPTSSVVVLDPGLQPGLADVWTLLAERSLTSAQGTVLATEKSAGMLDPAVPWRTIVRGICLGDTSWLDAYCRREPGLSAEKPKCLVLSEPGLVKRVIKDKWTPPSNTHWMLVLVSRSVFDAVAIQSMAIAGAHHFFTKVREPYSDDLVLTGALVLCSTQHQCQNVCEQHSTLQAHTTYSATSQLLSESSAWLLCEDLMDHSAWMWYPLLKAYCEREVKPKVVWLHSLAVLESPIDV